MREIEEGVKDGLAPLAPLQYRVEDDAAKAEAYINMTKGRRDFKRKPGTPLRHRSSGRAGDDRYGAFVATVVAAVVAGDGTRGGCDCR